MTDDTPNPTTPDAAPPAEPGSVPSPTPAAEPAPSAGARRSSSADIRSHRPEYKGAELDPERGPGLGCFWFQVFVLGFFIVLIPIGLNLAWPYELLAILLFVVIGLLLLTGQTVIFLLRLVAADRRAQGRRRPLASPTKTVGELEDDHRVAHAVGGAPRPAAEPEPLPEPEPAAQDEAAELAEPEPIPEPELEPFAQDEAAELAEPEPVPEPAPAEAAESRVEPAAEPEPAAPAETAEPAGGPPDDARVAPTPEGAETPEEPDPGVRQ